MAGVSRDQMGYKRRTFAPHQSPFSTPFPGDVLRSKVTGQVREVLGCTHDTVVYAVDEEVRERTCTPKTWREWCSRNKAEFIESRVKR